MGSVNIDSDTKRELDDSGCVQDEFVSTIGNHVGLLDLSDDVLLYILRYCDPRDLKALAFSCTRLGRLVRERSLWKHVNAISMPCSQARFKWLIENVLHPDTRVLKLNGFARNTLGCLGLITVTRKEAAEEKKQYMDQNPSRSNEEPIACDQIQEIPIPVHLERHHARLFISAQRSTQLPRFRGFPSWTKDCNTGRSGPQPCRGPQYSFSLPLLQQFSSVCTQLSELVIDFCNIDCNRINLGFFPNTIKKLSLRGTRCYNMAIDKSFLFKVQDYLPQLQTLDVSDCEWMDPATLLPLSKLTHLEDLVLRDCPKLAEFVAYASLTSRYGFRALKSLDLRGSPVGDSEVSALGWLPRLECLRLAAQRSSPAVTQHHAHYADDPKMQHRELDDWEQQEPDYLKSNPASGVEDSQIDCVPSTSFMEPAPVDQTPNQRFGTYNPSFPEKDKEGAAKRKPEDGSGDSADINGASPVVKRQKTDNDANETINDDTKNTCHNPVNDNVNNENDNVNNSNDNVNNANDNDERSKNRMKFNCEINVNVIGVIETDSDDTDDVNDEHRDVNNRADNPEPRIVDNNPKNEVKDENNANDGEAKTAKANVPNLNEAANDANEAKNEPANEANEAKNEAANEAGNEVRNENNRMQNPRDGPDCVVDCIKIDQLIDVSELRCGRQNELIVIASTSRSSLNNPLRNRAIVEVRQNQEAVQADGSAEAAKEVSKNSNDENKEQKKDSEPKQNLKRPNENVNEGASTSKDNDTDGTDEPKEKYVRFRKNQEPVYVNCAPENDPANQNPPNPRREPLPPMHYQIEPRHHVLYVSVGPQLNTYRFPRESSELHRHLNLNFRPTHVDSTSLITDFAMRRFGRADGEDVNIIHIGPNGPMVVGHDTGSRPDRSSLRILSVTGYRNITDRSLVHLATAAPFLRQVDFSDTNVTENGAESFRGMRPDCELVFSKFTDKKD